jgi:hypothetical protein
MPQEVVVERMAQQHLEVLAVVALVVTVQMQPLLQVMVL